MIYVQHLLGVGHLQRMLHLSAALAKQRFTVVLVSGGRPIPTNLPADVVLRQLPPVYSPDARFSRLLDSNDKDIDDNWRAERLRQLLGIFEAISPQVLITETFPFGRRMMRFELLPLLQAATASVDCVETISSIRDILQPKSKPGRNQEICDLIKQNYTRVLVHSDKALIKLEHSFALTEQIADKVFYTGYIRKPITTHALTKAPSEQVLVSAGGSATGLGILETAIAARPMTTLATHHWRILVSPAIEPSSYRRLLQYRNRYLSVEPNRDDFTALLQRATLSISQAGYNTMTDLLGSNAAAVVVPFSDADEIEQTLRARRLQQAGRLVMLESDQLSAETLAGSIDDAVKLESTLSVDTNGANNSASMIAHWLDSRSAKLPIEPCRN